MSEFETFIYVNKELLFFIINISIFILLYQKRKFLTQKLGKNLYNLLGWVSSFIIVTIIGFFGLFYDISKLTDISPLFVVLSALLMFSLNNYFEEFKKERTNIIEKITEQNLKKIELSNIISHLTRIIIEIKTTQSLAKSELFFSFREIPCDSLDELKKILNM